ncbi:MAG: HWE histidine kinase domain-containing protein [Azospirillaceae bacterium]|nr:HWE histidine kinase domain-containing protein [Azospirillaceae bacterium]
MAKHPAAVLPKFVALAMELTGGSAAGLSLYEPAPVPGVFRWHNVCGRLAAFDGATTPRNYSPCGVTLDQGGPVLTRHAETMFDWIADAGITVPEVLLVPLYLDGDEPLGTLWIVAEEEGHFDSGHARVATELATFVGIALKVQRTEDRLRQALERQETLTHEMNHRVKNLFALAGAMIHFGARHARDKEDMAATLSGRLLTLAGAHELIMPVVGSRDGAATARDIADVITQIIRAHESPAMATRFILDGPALLCQPAAISPLALVVNELATNAVKYGALASDGGQVTIDWQTGDGQLHLRWRERGGAPVESPPTRSGFGTRLLDSSITGQFRGRYAYDWQVPGLVLTMDIPLAAIAV